MAGFMDFLNDYFDVEYKGMQGEGYGPGGQPTYNISRKKPKVSTPAGGYPRAGFEGYYEYGTDEMQGAQEGMIFANGRYMTKDEYLQSRRPPSDVPTAEMIFGNQPTAQAPEEGSNLGGAALAAVPAAVMGKKAMESRANTQAAQAAAARSAQEERIRAARSQRANAMDALKAQAQSTPRTPFAQRQPAGGFRAQRAARVPRAGMFGPAAALAMAPFMVEAQNPQSYLDYGSEQVGIGALGGGMDVPMGGREAAPGFGYVNPFTGFDPTLGGLFTSQSFDSIQDLLLGQYMRGISPYANVREIPPEEAVVNVGLPTPLY